MKTVGSVMRCRIDHRGPDGTGALVLHHPVGQLEAREVAEVPTVLAEAESAAVAGCFVAGFVAYDAAPAFDPAFRVPAGDGVEGPALPVAWFGLFAGATPAPPLRRWTATAAATSAPPTPAWTGAIDARGHAVAVGSIRDTIADGDAYLVNLATRFRRPWTDDDDPFELYRRLVSGYGHGYHAFLETAEWAVACASPELFFERTASHLATRPMKGTAPRGRWAGEDAERSATLGASPKEHAENVMVVDLLRNDLGRIAQPGTIEVPSLGNLERHPAVWQLTSTVTATIPSDTGLADVFAALFPCASVTGAPKISAMSTIADLERTPRGVYCGAVGLLTPDRPGGEGGPTARFAVAIRTATVDKVRRVAEYGAGGGISWDSETGAEWEEVLVKAKVLTGSAPSSLGVGEGLLETMGYLPGAGGGSVRHLHDHLDRLAASARYFGVDLPAGIGEQIVGAVAGAPSPLRVRVVLRPGGAVEVATEPFDPIPGPALRLCVDPEPVWSTDVGLFHKTTDRHRYEDRSDRHPDADDVVLVNERGEVTETTRANLAVCLDGRWWTPPLGCGLLPGVERARALDDGRLVERVLSVDEVLRADGIATLSSLRGWRDAVVRDRCPCRAR